MKWRIFLCWKGTKRAEELINWWELIKIFLGCISIMWSMWFITHRIFFTLQHIKTVLSISFFNFTAIFSFQTSPQLVVVTLTKINHGLDKSWTGEFSINVVCQFSLALMAMLWFNFILGLPFIFLCFKLIIIHYHTPKQRKIKFKPRIKLNHKSNITIMHTTFLKGERSQNINVKTGN